MKFKRGLALLMPIFLFACQPTASSSTVTILDNVQSVTLQTEERVPLVILMQAGIVLNPNDRVIVNGITVSPESPIIAKQPRGSNFPLTIQIRRAAAVTLITPLGEETILTSAFTVGDVLQETGIRLSANDIVDPSVNTSITNSQTTIYYTPARNLTITADGRTMQATSAAQTVGEALAGLEIPLLGLDYSLPFENEALPIDGQIKVVRVGESIILAQKLIPFETETIPSADVPLDQTQILSPGENGLSVQRIRVRYEDGVEVSRFTEEETIVHTPKARILAYGTKVETQTATVNGVQIEYWRAVQMYATSYSPCNLGTSTCGSTTASGKQLQKGMVALRTDLYFGLRGQRLFIPGYGFATVEDACGGCVGKPWIDLGFTDADYEPWHDWVTVYFLTPVPQNIPYSFE